MSVHRIRRRGAALALALVATLGFVALASSPVVASYPGNNGRIVFVRQNQIYWISPTGGSVHQLTSQGKNYRPKWSPDGTKIAYVHETGAGSRDIWEMNANGSAKTQVTHIGQVTGPSWKPDGTTLVFGGFDTTENHLIVEQISAVAPFGAPTAVLGDDLSDGLGPIWVDQDGTPAWSPDGAHIAWYSAYYPNSPDHYMIEFTVATSIINAVNAIGGSCCGEGSFADPAYSPANELGYTLQVDPQQARLFAPGITTTNAHDGGLAFAPQNNRIVFVNDASGTPKVLIANRNGTNRHVLVSNAYQPDWQPTH